jgi:hypothetical protein
MTESGGPIDHPQNPPPVPGALLDMLERARYDVAQILDGLVVEVDEAKTMPLSSSVIIGKDGFLQRLEGARAQLAGTLSQIVEDLPEELRAARWMVRERESYVARTNEKAREVIGKAKQRSDELISQSYIVAEAVAEANALVRNAENEARRIRLEAEDRAEGRLAEAETILGDLLEDVQSARTELHETLPTAPHSQASD